MVGNSVEQNLNNEVKYNMDGMSVKIIEDSINEGNRITTLQLKYHRYIHAEMLTHRMFSRSASSSRAIPINKIISQVWNNPAMPVNWGANISGMQAKTELSGVRLALAKFVWRAASKFACIFAYIFSKIGLHKQIGNRILEPWQFINVIVTATDFDNFFHLRIHPDAQPEIQELARKMKEAIDASTPKELKYGEWHLPYVSDEEKKSFSEDIILKMSTARCARVSYNNHNGVKPYIMEDMVLYHRLVGSQPIHASPAEHQATPGYNSETYYKNFKGWIQYRDAVEEILIAREIELEKLQHKLGNILDEEI